MLLHDHIALKIYHTFFMLKDFFAVCLLKSLSAVIKTLARKLLPVRASKHTFESDFSTMQAANEPTIIDFRPNPLFLARDTFFGLRDLIVRGYAGTTYSLLSHGEQVAAACAETVRVWKQGEVGMEQSCERAFWGGYFHGFSVEAS